MVSFESVKRMMGWCPNATATRNRSMQHIDFVNPSQTPSGRSNVGNVQSKNVVFYANSYLLYFCIVAGLDLVLFVFKNLDYAILIPIIVIIYSFLYFIVTKTYQANISIDEKGLHLNSLGLKNITLAHKDIKSVAPNKLVKTSNTLIAVILIIIVALFACLVVLEEWHFVITTAPLLLGCLLLMHKQGKEYHDLDTKFYVEYKNKKWYELTSHYSIVTDEMTASRIRAAIEHYMEAQ